MNNSFDLVDNYSNIYYNIYRCSSLVLAGPLSVRLERLMKENFNCVVYKHTNKINGKCYIGVVFGGRNPEQRWGIGGKNYLNNKQHKFARAILKYGWDNFEHEILFNNLSVEEAKEKEKELIQKYDSFRNGYNSTLGGDGSVGLKHSEKTKEILRQQHLGTKMSSASRQKMSLSQIEFRKKLTSDEKKQIFGLSGEKNGMYGKHRFGKENPFYGKKHSKETKEKIAKSHRGAISQHRKIVLQLNLNGDLVKEWESMTAAASYLNKKICHICQCCKGERKKAYGFIWKYYRQWNLSRFTAKTLLGDEKTGSGSRTTSRMRKEINTKE